VVKNDERFTCLEYVLGVDLHDGRLFADIRSHDSAYVINSGTPVVQDGLLDMSMGDGGLLQEVSVEMKGGRPASFTQVGVCCGPSVNRPDGTGFDDCYLRAKTHRAESVRISRTLSFKPWR
jgi:hypothetical protein